METETMKTSQFIGLTALIFAFLVLPSCGFIAINSNFKHEISRPKIEKQVKAKKLVKAKKQAKVIKKKQVKAKVKAKACQCPTKIINISIK